MLQMFHICAFGVHAIVTHCYIVGDMRHMTLVHVIGEVIGDTLIMTTT